MKQKKKAAAKKAAHRKRTPKKRTNRINKDSKETSLNIAPEYTEDKYVGPVKIENFWRPRVFSVGNGGPTIAMINGESMYCMSTEDMKWWVWFDKGEVTSIEMYRSVEPVYGDNIIRIKWQGEGEAILQALVPADIIEAK